ncbi:MAG: glycosyltransferase family A protein [Candidatus Bathyarchaeia archaeon]|jgi:glycosyltransferase involved in cell wall biosynthesis
MLGSRVNIDRASVESDLERMDVVVPVKNTKDNWEECLDSFYREIPINRLLIGDGGSTDNTIGTAKKYPRVKVFDQSRFKSLSFRIKQLIDEVETEWFVYLHSDVSLPRHWYEEMCKYREKWDWFECKRVLVYHFEREVKGSFESPRAYSGSQMGRKEAFKNIKHLEDDYGYRMEDLLFQELVENGGFKYGKVPTTFHYHHVVRPSDETSTHAVKFRIKEETTKEWKIDVAKDMVGGFIKYMSPEKKDNVETVNANVRKLRMWNAWDQEEWEKLIQQANPAWTGKIESTLKSFTINTYIRIKRALGKEQIEWM